MKKTLKVLFSLILLLPMLARADKSDTLIIQTFTFDSIITRGAVFQYPEDGGRQQKFLKR